MTYLEIDKAIVDITRQICAECKSRLDAIPKENTTERKAVQVEYGMYTFCGNAGLLFSIVGERDADKREAALGKRHSFLKRYVSRYPRIQSLYESLDEKEKMRFVATWQAELFIRDQWLGAQLSDLVAAEAAGDAKSAFELKIKIGAVQNMFAAWETWREENGVYPHLLEEERT